MARPGDAQPAQSHGAQADRPAAALSSACPAATAATHSARAPTRLKVHAITPPVVMLPHVAAAGPMFAAERPGRSAVAPATDDASDLDSVDAPPRLAWASLLAELAPGMSPTNDARRTDALQAFLEYRGPRATWVHGAMQRFTHDIPTGERVTRSSHECASLTELRRLGLRWIFSHGPLIGQTSAASPMCCRAGRRAQPR